MRAEIRKARDLTDKPIGLNINLFPSLRPQPVEEWVQVAVEEKVPVVESSGRSPEAIVAPLHAGGVKIMHKVAGVRFARDDRAPGLRCRVRGGLRVRRPPGPGQRDHAGDGAPVPWTR